MFNRAERDLLLKTAQELGAHILECREDKTDIRKRLDEQDETSMARHSENVKKLESIQTRTLIAIVTLLLTALGGLLMFVLPHVAFR